MPYPQNHEHLSRVHNELRQNPSALSPEAQAGISTVEAGMATAARFIKRGKPMMAWAILRSYSTENTSPRAVHLLRCLVVQEALAASYNLVSLVVPLNDTHDDLTFSLYGSDGFGYYDAEIVTQFLLAMGAVTVSRTSQRGGDDEQGCYIQTTFIATFGRSGLGDALSQKENEHA